MLTACRQIKSRQNKGGSDKFNCPYFRRRYWWCMGNCVGGFKKRTKKLQHRKKVRKIRICILGLDGAGKSTAVRALASEDIIGVLPTNGFTLHEFKYRKAEIIAYDLGGGERIRSIWRNYYTEVFGVIYVIDGSEQNRIMESGELLKNVISDGDLSAKPLLVILNKIDREGCIDEIQLTDRLNLHELANRYRTQIRVEICQSNAGTGRMMDPALKDGFEWLLEKIYEDYEPLEKRVNEALQQLKRRQDEARIRRKHQLAATVSSSTSSDERRPSDDDDGVGAAGAAQEVNDGDGPVPVTESVQPHATNSVAGTEKPKNSAGSRIWHPRNAVSPVNDLTPKATDGTLKYPEIFEISSRPPLALPPLKGLEELQGSNSNVQQPVKQNNKGIAHSTSFRGSRNVQSTKPVRGNQLIPLSVIPSRQPKQGPTGMVRIGSV